MRIASFNVESLFNRPKAMRPDWAEGRTILEQHASVNALLNEAAYTKAMKAEILHLLTKLGLKDKDQAEFALLRQDRGHLLTRHVDGTVEVVAKTGHLREAVPLGRLDRLPNVPCLFGQDESELELGRR